MPNIKSAKKRVELSRAENAKNKRKVRSQNHNKSLTPLLLKATASSPTVLLRML